MIIQIGKPPKNRNQAPEGQTNLKQIGVELNVNASAETGSHPCWSSLKGLLFFSRTFLVLRWLVPIFYCNLWPAEGGAQKIDTLQKRLQLSALLKNLTHTTQPNKSLSHSSTHVAPFFLKNINTMATSATATAAAHAPPPARLTRRTR
jgi:hypothetical protein